MCHNFFYEKQFKSPPFGGYFLQFFKDHANNNDKCRYLEKKKKKKKE